VDNRQRSAIQNADGEFFPGDELFDENVVSIVRGLGDGGLGIGRVVDDLDTDAGALARKSSMFLTDSSSRRFPRLSW
jgi:hypothetical protein